MLRAAFADAYRESNAATKWLRRLIELERAEARQQAAEEFATPVHRHTPGCGHYNSEYEL